MNDVMPRELPFGPVMRPAAGISGGLWVMAWCGAVRLAVVAGLCGAAAVAAQEYPARDVGGWTVAASKDGRGCFVTRDFDGGGETTLLLGLDVDGGNHLSVLNRNWSIKPKDRLALDFRLSNGGYPKHFAVGLASDGKKGFVTNFEPRFVTRFAASQFLHVFRGTVPVEKLALDGSGAAVMELRRCVALFKGAPVAAAPGAARADGVPTDPFAPEAVRKRRK